MRRVAVAVLVLVVAAAGVAGLVAFLNSRDDSTVQNSAGPGSKRPDGEKPVVTTGNVVLLFSDERLTSALRELARDIGGPATPAVRAAGQAVIVERQAGLRVPVVALTVDRRLEASGTDDLQLRSFIEYWLGRRGAG